MSGYLIFTYASYGEKSSDKKSSFLSGDGRIEDPWVKENNITMRWALTLDDLDIRVETKKGDEDEQDISFDTKFMLGIMDKLGNSN